jgi:hypothetical protein
MRRRDFFGLLGGAAAQPLAPWAQQSVMPTALTAQEVQNIALEAYIYFYPLVIMDVTRKHFTNIEADKKFGRGPMNTFNHARLYSPRRAAIDGTWAMPPVVQVK